MITMIVAICSFGVVHSQAPFAFNPSYSSSSQSVSYSGPGNGNVASSGTATAYSGTGTAFALNPSYSSSSQSVSYSGPGSASVASSGTATAYSGTAYASSSGSAVSSSGSLPALPPVSPVPDPHLEPFAHSLAQLLSSSPVLNAIPDFVLDDPYPLIHKHAKNTLELGNVNDLSLAELAATAGRDVGKVPRDLYLNAIAHSFAKLLSLNNVLTEETVLTYPRLVLRYVEESGIRNGIRDHESVIWAVKSGVLDFATSIGINNIPNVILEFQLFEQELKALASGERI